MGTFTTVGGKETRSTSDTARAPLGGMVMTAIRESFADKKREEGEYIGNEVHVVQFTFIAAAFYAGGEATERRARMAAAAEARALKSGKTADAGTEDEVVQEQNKCSV